MAGRFGIAEHPASKRSNGTKPGPSLPTAFAASTGIDRAELHFAVPRPTFPVGAMPGPDV